MIEIPKDLRARIKKNAKNDGRTMLEYLKRVIPVEFPDFDNDKPEGK